ncbi:citramalate synthase [candidate division WOR-3 bacterium]|nr:citramalate synthase [candidate division WOR-3 bacterium]
MKKSGKKTKKESEQPPKKVKLYDATLREGTQAEGVSLSVTDKLKITKLLDELGIDYIEGGWPGSNPKDVEYFKKVKKMKLENSRIAAFGSTCRKDTDPVKDKNIKALLDSEAPVITIFGKTWTLHVEDALRVSLNKNLQMIENSIKFLKSKNREVVFDAEHFFDGYKADSGYAVKALSAAASGGADVLVLCDTNGGTLPHEVKSITEAVKSKFPDKAIGIHTHNDSGTAMGNTLAAVQAGATHVQGTTNGYGERCGNADLSALIPNLQLKMGIEVLPPENLVHLTPVANAVAFIANQPPPYRSPYIGRSAFAHKGGIHVSAMRRNPLTYQHINPELVGNESRVLISELAGKSNLHSKLEEMKITGKIDNINEVLEKIKALEYDGFSFEAAEASVELLLLRCKKDYKPPFKMLDFTVVVEHREKRGIFAEATVKVLVGNEISHVAAEGDGPVDALYIALTKALREGHPNIERFHLADYKVHIINSSKGTGAITRVMIDMQLDNRYWSTVGASPNIIEASWTALSDAMEYGIYMEG